jgi:iron complex outermembrane receptor protein
VPYVRLGGETHATQSRLDPSDVAPSGFTLWHLSTGVALATARGPLQVDLVVRNLTDRRYRPFLSRYKEFADAPGRSVQLRVSVGVP